MLVSPALSAQLLDVHIGRAELRMPSSHLPHARLMMVSFADPYHFQLLVYRLQVYISALESPFFQTGLHGQS